MQTEPDVQFPPTSGHDRFGHQAEAIRDAILTIAHAAKSRIDSATGNKD